MPARFLATFASRAADDEESANSTDIANLYSYCVEVTLRSDSCLEIVAPILGATFMVFIQFLFAFGFLDASLIISTLNTQVPSMQEDPVRVSFFYSNTVVRDT